MKIEFENGSVIKSIDDVGECTRSKRYYEYIDKFNQCNNSLFNPKDIKSLDYNELNGKILKIVVIENEGIRMVAGQDINDRTIYIISYENIK